jgi:hypothetical protein
VIGTLWSDIEGVGNLSRDIQMRDFKDSRNVFIGLGGTTLTSFAPQKEGCRRMLPTSVHKAHSWLRAAR